MSAKYTLVLDLDETLVHSEVQPALELSPSPGRKINLKIEFGGAEFDVRNSVCCSLTPKVMVAVRPGFDEFLKYVSQHFEVVIFTASNKVLAL